MCWLEARLYINYFEQAIAQTNILSENFASEWIFAVAVSDVDEMLGRQLYTGTVGGVDLIEFGMQSWNTMDEHRDRRETRLEQLVEFSCQTIS